jgi:hypothetical protein
MRRGRIEVHIFYSLIFMIGVISCIGISNAGAQEWSDPVRISGFAWGYYPQILATGDTAHVAYSNDIGWPRICYVRSSDAGEIWSSPRVLSDTTEDAGCIIPQIIEFESHLMVLWKANLPGGWHDVNIGFSVSTDNGITWSDPGYILDPGWETMYNITASNTGMVVNITITLGIAGDNIYIYNVRSTDFGQSWTEPVIIFHPYEITGNSDQESFGNYVHFIWSGSFDPDSFVNLYYTRSTDGGLTWSENTDLNESDVLWNQHPAIDVDDFGNICVCWKERLDVAMRLSYDSGSTWSPIITVTTSHYVWGYTDVVLEENTILSVWQDIFWGRGDIIFSKSSDGGQSWDDEYYVDRDTCNSQNPSLAGSAKRHYLIWYERRSYEDSTHGLFFSRWPDEYTATVKDEDGQVPESISLFAYPKPFNSSTVLAYQGFITDKICIYDISGRLVKRFEINRQSGSITWDATTEDGTGVASGIYFARAIDSQDNYIADIKLLYLK